MLSIEEAIAITQLKVTFFNPIAEGCCHGNQLPEHMKYLELS
jgi:hypothetical protein